MPKLKLTAKKVAALRASGVQTDYFDVGAKIPGFGLRVSAAGRRVWFLLYRKSGKQKRLTVGTNPPMGLEKARSAARLSWLGVQVEEADPAGAKKASRSADTFETLALRFIEEHSKAHKKSWREDGRQLRTMVFPQWRNRPATEIERSDVRKLLADVAKARGGITANRLRALLSKLFRWAVSQDYLEANPASELPKLTRETSRARVLSDDEIRAFWARLDGVETDETLPSPVVLWLRLRLLTAQRGGSVAKMRWADLDLDRKVWEIPAADMKAGNSHVVPLSPSVVDLLTERRKAVDKDAAYVLEGGRSRRLRLGVTDAIGLEDFTPHDLRRTAATGMARAGISRFDVGRVLGHIDRSVTGIYDRYEYLNEKRVALDAWARVLTAILEGKPAGTVVPFARS
jgi:integrase